MLDVISYVEERAEIIKRKVQEYKDMGETVSLAIITDKNGDGANKSYIKSKKAFAEKVGIECKVVEVDWDYFQNRFALDTGDVDGEIVQYPFYDYTFEEVSEFVTRSVRPVKDVDGIGKYSNHHPCTPLGIVNYIDHLISKGVVRSQYPNVLVVGCGDLIGKPLVKMLMDKKNCSVSMIRSSTPKEVADKLYEIADIVVFATPKPSFFSNVKKDVVYIDCGSHYEGKKLLGNISREVYSDELLATPVPNGVGRMTVLSLFENLLDAKQSIVSSERMKCQKF